MIFVTIILTLLPFGSIGSAPTNVIDLALFMMIIIFMLFQLWMTLAKGILRGCPFGGVGFLWHKCFNRNIQVLKSDPCGRCLVIKLNIESKAILLFNLYLP